MGLLLRPCCDDQPCCLQARSNVAARCSRASARTGGSQHLAMAVLDLRLVVLFVAFSAVQSLKRSGHSDPQMNVTVLSVAKLGPFVSWDAVRRGGAARGVCRCVTMCSHVSCS
eukprot:Skav208960  [mRNA]  locus=scaffold1580:317608:322366:- [translate_table: standard]